jgi:hypothetical protein
MDRAYRLRLQRFLTIADTIHDFGDLSRYPIVADTNSLDKRRALRERIIYSLMKDIHTATYEEYIIIRSLPENESTHEFRHLYEEYFENMDVPIGVGKDYSVFDIIKTCLSANGLDYTNEGDLFKKLVIDRQETTPEHLYGQLSDLSGRRFIKYVLDKNHTDKTLFCVDPNLIKLTTHAPTIDPVVKSFIFKSRYKGLFDDFECQRNKVAQTSPNSNTMTRPNDCCHKDNCEYSIKHDECETLVLTEVGVKNLPPYKLVYSHDDQAYVRINFKKRALWKGLTLFTQALIEMETHDLVSLQNTALQVIDLIFSMRCDRFMSSYCSSSGHEFTSLNPIQFTKAIYDMKRAMDYLPVKAAKTANVKFAQHDMI